MNSISNRRKKKVDRISNLPNSLISLILSFLSTKDAVRTSVLSTQWIRQWTSITHLSFDDHHNNSYESPSTEASFVNFVYRVLFFKMTRLDLFKLATWRDYDVAHINSWLYAALSRQVREIDLSVSWSCYEFPPRPWRPLEPVPPSCLFSSTTLVILKLGFGFTLKVPKIFSLDSLKILHFSYVEFEDNKSLSRLVSSCPVLEELKLQGHLGETMNVLNISSHALKRLILNQLSDPPYVYDVKVVLNTPNLEYLEHVDDEGVPYGYHVKMGTLNCLDRAHLCLRLDWLYEVNDDDKLILAKSMADLAVAISHVRFLYLSEWAIEALYQPFRVLPHFELPKFPHLTELKMDAIVHDEELLLLVAFLQSSPQLTSLSFSQYYEMEGSWNPPTVVPFCMKHNLKVIEVEYFEGRELEFGMVEYFLRNTVSLKELILSNLWDEKLKLIQKVLKLPKMSKSCKVVLT